MDSIADGRLLLTEEEIYTKINKNGKYSRSQLITPKMKENNYVASQFKYIEDYRLYKFCQNSPISGNLGFGAESFSPSYEDY